MFEVPFNFILINPAIDIILFLSLAYFFLFKYYKILLNRKVEKIMWIDLQATVIFISLGYLNYSDSFINFFGFKMEWWFFILLSQFLIKGVYSVYYFKDTKEYLKKIKKTNKEKEEENLIEVISNMKSVSNLMEEDLNKYKIQGNKKTVEKIQSEIEKIEVNMKELEEKLRELRSNKND